MWQRQSPPPSVERLRAALAESDTWTRLHAVKALAGVDHPAARDALIAAMHDDVFGVRWDAAEALAGQGSPGVVAVLRALAHGTPSPVFLHAAACALRHAPLTVDRRRQIAPVLDALRRPAADLEAPLEAQRALADMQPSPPAPFAEPPPPWYRIPRRRGRRSGIVAYTS